MQKRISVADIINRKNSTPLVCLTAYTASFAKIFDKYCDIILVGDTLGMIIYGMESTIAVTLDMMINHGKAVVKSSNKACVIVDMPFATYQESPKQAFRNAAKILKETGCTGVKLEGGVELAETIEFLTQNGIPVMAHIGLMPQHINVYGSYKYQGRNVATKNKILLDAKKVAQSGAFAVVLESIDKSLAEKITKEISIPTIGIGASAKCDGQVLVCDDMLGLFTDFKPKFVKRYANLAQDIQNAVSNYSEEVKLRKFPDDNFCF